MQNEDYEKVAGNVGYSMNVCPCHHSMARPHVVDGGTASNMEGSCE